MPNSTTDIPADRPSSPDRGRVDSARQEWLAVLSAAVPHELCDVLAPFAVDAVNLRPPEVGLALVTGRVGATGAPFGLGEMTVSRCVVQADGHLGVGYIAGRDTEHARQVALADALLQGPRSAELQALVVEPLRRLQHERRRERIADTESSRVQFLTMVRGD